jgi:PAS domain S-box-containing protein
MHSLQFDPNTTPATAIATTPGAHRTADLGNAGKSNPVPSAAANLLPDRGKDHFQATTQKNSREMIIALDRRGTILTVSRSVSRFGYSRDHVIGQPFVRFLHPEDVQSAMGQLFVSLRTRRRKMPDLMLRVICADQSYRWLKITPMLRRSSSGRYSGIVGVGRDITAAKRAADIEEDSLRNYHRNYDNSRQAIWVLQKNRVKYANPKARRFSRYFAVDLAAVPFLPQIHPEDWQRLIGRYRDSIRERRLIDDCTFRLRTASEGDRWVKLTAQPIQWGGLPAALFELKQMPALQSAPATDNRSETQSQTVIKRMAGGVAHSFNNILMGIQGNISILYEKVAKDSPPYRHLESIQRCINEGATVSRQLLDFAQTNGRHQVPVDLLHMIGKLQRTFDREHPDVRLSVDIAADLRPLRANLVQLRQALLNVLNNAAEAMPLGGNVALNVANARIEQPPAASDRFPITPGEYVEITIRDQGPGMDDETLAMAFEPFYSTKKMEIGKGLGLAAAASIIENHGGGIYLECLKKEGLQVTILLPVCGIK